MHRSRSSKALRVLRGLPSGSSQGNMFSTAKPEGLCDMHTAIAMRVFKKPLVGTLNHKKYEV